MFIVNLAVLGREIKLCGDETSQTFYETLDKINFYSILLLFVNITCFIREPLARIWRVTLSDLFL